MVSKRAASKKFLFISLSPAISMSQQPCSMALLRGITEVLRGSWTSVHSTHSSVVAPAFPGIH